MSARGPRAAAKALRAGLAQLSAPLSAEDRRYNWTPELQRSMADWFGEMLRRLDAGGDLSKDYVKIGRDLDMSGVTEGPLYKVCLDTQLRLMDALGNGSDGRGAWPPDVGAEPPQ